RSGLDALRRQFETVKTDLIPHEAANLLGAASGQQKQPYDNRIVPRSGGRVPYRLDLVGREHACAGSNLEPLDSERRITVDEPLLHGPDKKRRKRAQAVGRRRAALGLGNRYITGRNIRGGDVT